MSSIKKIIWLSVICILLAGGVYYAVSIYTPSNDTSYTNISISARDGKERIATGFRIDTSKSTIIGNTSYVYQNFKVPQENIKIKNINIENQNYYEIEKIYNVSNGKNTRIDIQLESMILPELIIEDKYEEDSILLTLKNGNFKEVDFCLDGSINYMLLNSEGFEEISKPQEFNSYEVCYDGNFSISSENKEKNIEITYSTVLEPNENDYIVVGFIDVQGNVLIERIK